jgi:CHAT domain-containing protein/Flp pilus assembly protein TadD
MLVRQVDSLIKVSRELTGQRQYDKALEVNAIAEKIVLDKVGRESALYGNTCFNHGRVNAFKGNFNEAEKWYYESLAIREKVLGKKNPDYAWTLNNLGVMYMSMGIFEKAEPLLLEAQVIRENVLGKMNADYAMSLNNLANLYMYSGSFEKAESLYLDALAIRENVLGRNHPDFATSLNNLGLYYYKIGENKKAETFLLESKEIREEVLSKDHPEYSTSLNNLAALYQQMFNYEKAELLYIESKSIREKSLGKEHPLYGSSLSNLASLYFNMGQFKKAEPLYLESKAIREKALGKNHPEYLASLLNLAVLYMDLGQFDISEKYFKETKEIQKEVIGDQHPDYAITLNSMANLYSAMNNYEKAEPLLLESKAIREKILGKDHPSYLWNLKNLTFLYEQQAKYSLSEPLLEELSVLQQRELTKASTFLSEAELAKYTKMIEDSGDNLGAYLLSRNFKKMHTGELSSLAYNHSLLFKGFLQTAAARLRSLASTSKESEEISLKLKSYRRRLSEEYTKPIIDRKQIAVLEEKATGAEKELARSVAGYDKEVQQVNWKEVQKKLSPNEAALEFIHFKINFPNKLDSVMYAALLIKADVSVPIFVSLFEEKSIDSLVHNNSTYKADYVNDLYTLASRGMVEIKTPKRSLFEILWKPLEQYLNGITTIYYSPSGLLHRINLDALPLSEIETLADKYHLIELNSTRQLVIPGSNESNNESVLYGGIQYEPDSNVKLAEPIIASRSGSELSFSEMDSTMRGGNWNYLAGTEREVNSLEKIMMNAGINVTLKKGYEATEESFKNLSAMHSSSPRIIHIATHGYFFSDHDRAISAAGRMSHDSATSEGTAKAATLRKSKGMGEDEPVFKLSDHPMLRSGLIMAGGNAAWQGNPSPQGSEDGILTAYEISQMNLSNTELVVLSACETGLGEIQGNEGVYGLQRAFKIAGAKYLIMSLWQVPDKQTSLLMTTFYRKWLEEKMTIPNAFHAAQKELRNLGLDPYQWAGFVLVE